MHLQLTLYLVPRRFDSSGRHGVDGGRHSAYQFCTSPCSHSRGRGKLLIGSRKGYRLTAAAALLQSAVNIGGGFTITQRMLGQQASPVSLF